MHTSHRRQVTAHFQDGMHPAWWEHDLFGTLLSATLHPYWHPSCHHPSFTWERDEKGCRALLVSSGLSCSKQSTVVAAGKRKKSCCFWREDIASLGLLDQPSVQPLLLVYSGQHKFFSKVQVFLQHKSVISYLSAAELLFLGYAH